MCISDARSPGNDGSQPRQGCGVRLRSLFTIRRVATGTVKARLTGDALFQMDKLVFHAVDEFDGTQNVNEWIRELERANDFANWGRPTLLKVALIRLKGEASEFVSHLQEEGKAKDWEELKTALQDRYQTTRREQWHQFLLNTGQQEGKTVQEWAQLVRKLSLASLSPEDRKVGLSTVASQPETAREEERPATSRNGTPAPRSGTQRNPLLDYIRRTNFIRGLRPSLRKAVWRHHCTTFDEAVKAAAEEEALEVTTHEAEVLSSYRDGPTKEDLIDTLVAALEIRDEKRRKAVAGEEEGMVPERHRAGRQPAPETYPEQLPLPQRTAPQAPSRSPSRHTGDRGRARRSWGRPGRAPAGAEGSAERRLWSDEEWRMFRDGVCFNCRGRGHIARYCNWQAPARQTGNGGRRPL